jgi:putative ABC transport system permease protein
MIRQLIALGRGLAHRAGSAGMTLVVAIVAAAAAAAGPVYYQAAQHSILSDTVSTAPVIGRGYQVTMSGSVQGTLTSLNSYLQPVLDQTLGARTVRSLFEPPIESIQGTGDAPQFSQTFPMVWQTDACSHLILTGQCPTKAFQVIISKSDAALTGWRIGTKLLGTSWPTLTVTGIYKPLHPAGSYWDLHSLAYFPREVAGATLTAPGLDALFTSSATMSAIPVSEQGQSEVDDTLATGRVGVADVSRLENGLNAFVNSAALQDQEINVSSTLPGTLGAVVAGWRSVSVPVTLTTVTILLLSLLLLFLIVTDAVEARGTEIALAKLRGHGRLGILLFGLSEPAVVLLVALPVGALAGWAAARELARSLLAPGTPVAFPWTAWAAAAVAVAGGFAALILAAQRALRRGVVEQLRRPSRLAAGRGWVVDSILLTGSLIGLFEVLNTPQIGSANHGALELLVPGLLGLAVAVIASRLLPLACRALYGVSSRHGGLAPYLALRHIARRDGGVRTTIVLATAFSLASFAFAAWTVGQRNYGQVAGTETGAPAVLSVSVPAGKNLGQIVDKADPSGRLATVVDNYIGVTGSSAGEVTLGVDPARFARIAYWPRQLSASAAAQLAARLQPPATAPIVLTGDAMRVTVDVHSLSMPGEQLYANLTVGATPLTFGSLPSSGKVTLTQPLTGCPCVLQSLAMTQPGGSLAYGGSTGKLSGSITISGIQQSQHGQWIPVAPQSVLDSATAWRDATISLKSTSATSQVAAGPQGLTWSISNVPTAHDPTLAAANVPAVMPAIVAAPLLGHGQQVFNGDGLDGSSVTMHVLAALPYIPGAPSNGVIIDRQYAELEAQQDLSLASQQVWLGSGALPLIQPKLRAAGIRIVSESSIAQATVQLERQGPALASALFLGDAAAAALLAAGAAILGLYVSARRRRYEYAAMEAAGVRRRSLRAALLLELGVVLGFGTLVGALTGLIGARYVLRSVPEFITQPAAPKLSYVASAGPVAALLGAAALLLIVATVVSSITLIRGVRADLLREAAA